MSRLPVITSFGGINAAGRASAHHAYRRMVIDALPGERAAETWQALAALMGPELPGATEEERCEYMRRHTLVRRIEPELFDTQEVPCNFSVAPGEDPAPLVLETSERKLPQKLPPHWRVEKLDGDRVRLVLQERDKAQLLLAGAFPCAVSTAGQLPRGFAPGALYPSRAHPRGLEMAVYAASDALDFLGIDWERIRARVPPHEISVYAGSAMSQLDARGYGGMLQARLGGGRPSARHCPFGFAEMPADFINAYLLGNLGNAGAVLGACASFLYNLRLAVMDIQSGRARVVLVGASEAPVTPEIIEGYAVMGALASDDDLRELDGLAADEEPDYARACRPFAENRGFTIAESAQFAVLMDDALALEMGARIHGAVAEVCINADGYKKSISAPGVGNYLSCCRALACGRAILGEDALRHRSFVLAHGTGTPQNRVTESRVLDYAAEQFGIRNWPVAAIKCFVGHSIGAAAGDQLAVALGVWAHGILPGICTIDALAADVSHKHLQISPQHLELEAGQLDCALINAKGFGGNNASALLLAPQATRRMLETRHGKKALRDWRKREEQAQEQGRVYDAAACRGETRPRYLCDDQYVRGETDLQSGAGKIRFADGAPALDLDVQNPYPDMC